MQPLFEHRLYLDGFSTRALELEGTGPPLILLHGWGDSADTWRPLLDRLGRLDRRAIAIDLPGFGEASAFGPGALLPQLDAVAGALVDLVADEAREPVVVAGNSLGGAIALRLGERADLPISGLVPIAPAGLEMPGWFDIIERDPVLRRLLALPVPVPRVVLERAVGEVYRRLVFARPGAADPGVIAGFTGHHATRSRARLLLESGRRLLAELQAEPFALSAVRPPVLLVWGTRDRMVSDVGARRVLEALPATRVELLEGCGHCPQLEATERLTELLLGFPDVRLARAA